MAEVFTEKSNVIHLSTGDIFRKEIKTRTELGILAESYISKGFLVPDSVTNDIIKGVLTKDPKASYLFDGYPRTVNQAECLKSMMKELNMKLDGVFDLEVPDDLVIYRLTARRVCSKCGAIYNLNNHRPNKDGICDVCGGVVVQREDDQIEAIKRRLDVYKNQTQPLIDYYKKENLLKTVDGAKDAIDVYLAITGILSHE